MYIEILQVQIQQYDYQQYQQQNMLTENYLETIKQLKTKLHHSFIELSDLQQLHQQELDSQKHQYQQKIDELVKQNELLKSKLKQSQNVSQKNIETIFDDIDDSFFQLRIKKDFDENYADQTIQELLSRSPLKRKTTYLEQLQNKVRSQCAFIPNELQIYFQSVKQLQKQNARNKDDLLELGNQYNRVVKQMEHNSNLVIELREREKAMKNSYEQLSIEHTKLKSQLTAIQNQRKHYLVKSCSSYQIPKKFNTSNRTSKQSQLSKNIQEKDIKKLFLKRSQLHL